MIVTARVPAIAQLSPPSADVSRRLVAAVFAFATVGACILALCIAFFVFHAHHGVARAFARIIPVPAAVVDGRIVWYHEVVERANALELLSGVSHDDAIARALLLSERCAVVQNLAQSLGVEERTHVGAASPVRAALAMLVETAGWSGHDMSVYGAEAFVRSQDVELAALKSATLQAAARARLESVQRKYAQGIGFADLALQYSKGAAAGDGGDLGYVDLATLPEDLHTAVSTLSVGEVSDIVETPYAFWLAKVEGVDGEGDDRRVWLRVIEVKKDLLGAIVDAEMRSVEIRQILQ